MEMPSCTLQSKLSMRMREALCSSFRVERGTCSTYYCSAPGRNDDEQAPYRDPYAGIGTEDAPVENQSRPFDGSKRKGVYDFGDEETERPCLCDRSWDDPDVLANPVRNHYIQKSIQLRQHSIRLSR